MPGMNSGLSPDDPTLVAAFRSALLHKGAGGLAAGTGRSYQALAVSGSKLTAWQLSRAGWAKTQLINVPIEYGSSG